MREQENFVNVIIYDGNRKINWDFKSTLSLREAIERWGFKWVKNSVRVNGFMIADSLLYHPLSSFVYSAEKVNRYNGRLYVILESVKEDKKKNK